LSQIREVFARNLKRYRLQQGFSQYKLAELLGINLRYIQQLEGKKTPNVKLDTLAQLANALTIRPEDLLRKNQGDL